MAFDLSKLQSNPQPAPVAPAPAVASAPAVLINRPASQRPVVAPAEALTVTTIEGSAAAHALVEFVDTEGEESPKEQSAAPSAGGTAPAILDSALATPPRARRGRPRKTPAPTAGADTAAATRTATESGGAPAPDPLAPTTTAPGCAPSVGDLAAVVCALEALADAVEALLAPTERAYGFNFMGCRTVVDAARAAIRGVQ